jgi:hypothetical protein
VGRAVGKLPFARQISDCFFTRLNQPDQTRMAGTLKDILHQQGVIPLIFDDQDRVGFVCFSLDLQTIGWIRACRFQRQI